MDKFHMIKKSLYFKRDRTFQRNVVIIFSEKFDQF